MSDPTALRRAEAVRHFSRFYTQYIGALHEGLLKSPFSLTEVRVLHELSSDGERTAATLARNLGLDTGYLSRLLTSFERRDLISRRPSQTDARQSLIALTDKGRGAHQPLDDAALSEVSTALSRLAPVSQEQLVYAMKVIERLLTVHPGRGDIALRAPRSGELGWLISRQAQQFAAEYAWSDKFEARLARIVADYVDRESPRETFRVAERDGAIVGTSCLTAVSDEIAAVRLLYVEPDMRHYGLGGQLLDDCLQFAGSAGYRRVSISVASVLKDARRLCERGGFRRTTERQETRFGKHLTIERWERSI